MAKKKSTKQPKLFPTDPAVRQQILESIGNLTLEILDEEAHLQDVSKPIKEHIKELEEERDGLALQLREETDDGLQ